MKSFELRTMSKSELRALYGISRETFNEWIKRLKEPIPNYKPTAKILTPAQVKFLVTTWGEP